MSSKKIVFISDSMLKYVTSHALNLPNLYETVTFAWSGATTTFIDQKCKDINFTLFDYIFVEIGTNDISRNLSATNGAIAGNIQDFLRRLTVKSGCKIYLCSIFNRNDNQECATKVNSVNDLLKWRVPRMGSVFNFFDMRLAFKSTAHRRRKTGEMSAKETYLAPSDHLHLNKKGVKEFCRLVRSKLRKNDPEAFKNYVSAEAVVRFDATECRKCRAKGHPHNFCQQFLNK